MKTIGSVFIVLEFFGIFGTFIMMNVSEFYYLTLILLLIMIVGTILSIILLSVKGNRGSTISFYILAFYISEIVISIICLVSGFIYNIELLWMGSLWVLVPRLIFLAGLIILNLF